MSQQVHDLQKERDELLKRITDTQAIAKVSKSLGYGSSFDVEVTRLKGRLHEVQAKLVDLGGD